MLDTIVGRSPTHKEHIQSWACPEARSRPGEPSYPLPAGFIRRWLLDRGSSATHHRSGGHQPAHQSMINRRLMIVPPAMPSSGRTEQLDEREKKFLRLLLEMANGTLRRRSWYVGRLATGQTRGTSTEHFVVPALLPRAR